MGTVNKEQVSKEQEGLTDLNQESNKLGQTNSEPDDIVTLETTKKFRDPVTNELLTYDVIRAKMERGNMFDKTQSALQKEQNEHKLTKERAEKAEWRAELAEQNQRISRIENPVDETQDDGYDDNDSQGIPVERIVRQMKPEFEKRDNKLTEYDKRIADIERREAEQAQREEYRRRQDVSEQANMIILEKEYPALNPSELKEINRQETLAAQATAQGLNATDNDEAMDKFALAKTYTTAAVKLRVAATIKQEAETRRKEQERRVETTSSSGRKEIIIQQSPTSNKDEIARRNKETIERARKNAEERENARKGLG